MPFDLTTVTVLGATGSIGRRTLDVLSWFPDLFHVRTLTANRRYREVIDAAVRIHADGVALADESVLDAARRYAPDSLTVTAGRQALIDASQNPTVDIVVSAIVGAPGLAPTLAAIRAGKRVALANKESMVIAGHVMTRAMEESGAEVIPIDSEHSAIFQCLKTGSRVEIDTLILTASGGPFRTSTADEMCVATALDALKHPTWDMGPKITIDSATLMNKALELIEACWMFGVQEDEIEVYIHPQSIVHSIVRWQDGSLIAQIGLPDMRIPIQYALTYPARLPGESMTLDITDLSSLHFEPPDEDRFPTLMMGRLAAREGMCLPAALNAANEEAVAMFLDGRITLDGIFDILYRTIDHHRPLPETDLQNILETDQITRAFVRELNV